MQRQATARESNAFDRDFAVASGGTMTLRRRPHFANEPANISGLHWIRRYSDFLDVAASGAIERAKLKPCWPRRDLRKVHTRLACGATESLQREQRNCGWVIGHCIPPLGQAGAQSSQSPVDAEASGDGSSMLALFWWRWSILVRL
jgi:hypothetical protein